MLRNYLAVAFRNLASHRLHAAINIGGLAVGLAACLMILLFVRDELSYERWLPDADRIVAIESTFDVPGRDPISFAAAPGPLKDTLDKEFASDLVQVVRIHGEEEPVRVGDRRLVGETAYVDANFFEVFDLPIVAGRRDAALADNHSILLSETTARKYFGAEPAVGNTITLSDTHVFTVVGVFADLPRNTHLELSAIALFDLARYEKQPWVAQQWTSVNTRTYALLRDPGARARVAAALPAALDRNVTFNLPGIDERPSSLLHFTLRPILDIHLHASTPGYRRLGSFTAVVAFAGIALLILIIACINFVNLATARAMTRAREVAMRKVVGATRSQLIAQHLGEAVITALIALVLALAVVELAIGPFDAFLHKDLRLDLLGDPSLLLVVIGLVLVVGVVGGLYPALYLSRFQPARVLKANQSSVHGSSLVRTGLVVFQFAISIALMVCTATIYAQTVYARTLDLGFDHGDRVALTGLGDLPTKEAAATLERAIAALPDVEHAALSSDAPPLHNNNNTLLYPTATMGDEKLVVETLEVDPDFFAAYGVEPVAGRLFSAEHAGDFRVADDAKDGPLHQGIVINRAFAAKLGAARPEDVVGKVVWEPRRDDGTMVETTVVGVVDDLYLRSVRESVTPMAYYVSPPASGFNYLTVHVAPGRMRATMARIEEVWHQLVPDVPIRTEFLDASLAAQYDGDEQRGQIFAAFAGFAIVIACLGLFGLASFSAQRRTKEIGMRKVLGASVLDIVRLLVWQFSRPVLIANLIAWPVSYLVMRRWLAGFRHAIDLSAPAYLLGIFGGAAVLAMLIAWGTTAGHAYRVARANPGRALRTE
ncbi:MAG: ABC transporter permease [Kofleriaceae bacterium]|nr:ABC transporter permease [Myxococcales bacterium]MCB9565396.1 ABC transporter permease [Kofleriaceae bacterium]